MTLCQIEEREAGRSYPRTCPTCKLGACQKGHDYKSMRTRIEALEASVDAYRGLIGTMENDLVPAMTDRIKALEADRDRIAAEWAGASQANYERAKAAEAEVLRLRLILSGDVSRALGTLQAIADGTGLTHLREAADRLSAAISDGLRGGEKEDEG